MAHRIRSGDTGGIEGHFSFGSPRTTIGVTMAVAYAANASASGIFQFPWKPNEWTTVVDSNFGGDGLLLGHVSSGLTSANGPFEQNVLLSPPDGSQLSACNAAIAAATKTVGSMTCDGVAMRWFPSTFNLANDWPLGTWGCVRTYYQNLGSSSAQLQIFLTTALTNGEKTIVNISNLNMTSTRATGGYTGVDWNAYANANQGLGETPTTQTTFRYEDNMHWRAGAPVSCAQIGFGGSDVTPPAVPTNVSVQ